MSCYLSCAQLLHTVVLPSPCWQHVASGERHIVAMEQTARSRHGRTNCVRRAKTNEFVVAGRRDTAESDAARARESNNRCLATHAESACLMLPSGLDSLCARTAPSPQPFALARAAASCLRVVAARRQPSRARVGVRIVRSFVRFASCFVLKLQ